VSEPTSGLFFVQKHIRQTVPKLAPQDVVLEDIRYEIGLSSTEISECGEVVATLKNQTAKKFEDMTAKLAKLNSQLEKL